MADLTGYREATQFKKGEQRAVEAGRKGRAVLSENIRRRKELKECIDILLSKEMGKDADGNVMSGADALAAAMFKRALKGDTRAFTALRDTCGQKPVDKVMIAEVEQAVIDEVENIVRGMEEK